MATRNDTYCNTCHRKRLHINTCEDCGQTGLVGVKGYRGLYWHDGNLNDINGTFDITATRHVCYEAPGLLPQHKGAAPWMPIVTTPPTGDEDTRETREGGQSDSERDSETRDGQQQRHGDNGEGSEGREGDGTETDGEGSEGREGDGTETDGEGAESDGGGEGKAQAEQTPPDPLREAIWETVRPKVEELERDIQAASASGTITVEIQSPDGETMTIEGAHFETATLVTLMSAGFNVLLVGPPGSGKTHVAEQVAIALGKSWYPTAMHEDSDPVDSLGFISAGSEYVPSVDYRFLTDENPKGAVLGIDEMDRANPGGMMPRQMLTSNGYMAFPNGEVLRMRSNSAVVATANTYGTGRDRKHVTAQQQDGAVLDRWVVLDWDYDRTIEAEMARATIRAIGGDESVIAMPERQVSKYVQDNPDTETVALRIGEWTGWVWATRQAVEEIDSDLTVGLRAIKDGARLLAAGFTIAAAAEMRVLRGLDTDTRSMLNARAPMPTV